MRNNLEKAQKAFAFFISSSGAESQVAFDKLRELAVSLDDVAYQNIDGSWLTRWGSVQFDIGIDASSIDRAERNAIKQELERRQDERLKQEAENERQRLEEEKRQRPERERLERERQRMLSKNSRDIRHYKELEKAGHKFYTGEIAHDVKQHENHEAFNRGEGYLGSDGEYHLYSEMKWH